MATHSVPKLSPEEYLATERLSETKHEYFGGETFAMAGGSFAHNSILFNLTGLLYGALRGGSCRGYGSNLRVATGTSRQDLYTYPDLSILCGEPQFLDEKRDTLCNPIVLIEVLSPSTAAYDRGLKFEMYRRIASLRDYVLVEQDRMHVEVFSRQQDNSWVLHEANLPTESIPLSALQVLLTLQEIYESITFEEPKLRSETQSDNPPQMI